ncbi:MAG: chemotaxis protein CheW [Gemmatimonadetes bacterium]|nr:chemotaxis protein CheW [Gemmatimonadota bacterium]
MTRATLEELHVVARVGDERFAFAVADVEEVIDAPSLEWVPSAPLGVAGQLRHRERTLSAFDGAWAFGLAVGRVGGTALVLRAGDARTVLMVDDVDDLAVLDVRTLRPVPAGADAEGVLAGVCIGARADGGLVNLVRVDALLSRTAGIAPPREENMA